MSQVSTEEKPQGNDWRAALPAQWLPFVFCLEWLCTLRYAVGLVENRSVGTNLGLAIDSLHLGAAAALVCVAVWLQITIVRRIILLLSIWIISWLMDAVALFFDERVLPLPINAFWHEVWRAGLAELRLLSIFSSAAIAVSGSIRFFAISRAPQLENVMRAAQIHLADWLFWLTLFGFCFLPEPLRLLSPPTLTLPSDGGRGAFMPTKVTYELIWILFTGVVLWGLFILTTGWNWRLRIFVLVSVVTFPICVIGYLNWRIRPQISSPMLWASCAYMIIWTLPSIPSWLLFRWAGYRLYSPRHWIYKPDSHQIEPSAIH